MRNKIKNLDKHKKIFIKKNKIHNNLEWKVAVYTKMLKIIYIDLYYIQLFCKDNLN